MPASASLRRIDQREQCRRRSPPAPVAASASVSARPVSDLGVEPAPHEPAGAACGSRSSAAAAAPGPGPTTCAAPRRQHAPGQEARRCRDQDQHDDRHTQAVCPRRDPGNPGRSWLSTNRLRVRDGHAAPARIRRRPSGARCSSPGASRRGSDARMAGHPVRAFLVVALSGSRCSPRSTRRSRAGRSRRTRFPSTASATGTST